MYKYINVYTGTNKNISSQGWKYEFYESNVKHSGIL